MIMAKTRELPGHNLSPGEFLLVCQKGNLEIVKALVAKHNIQDWTIYQHAVSGDTALHLAVQAGHMNVVRYLCEELSLSQSGVNVTNKDMKRPIHGAAQFSRVHILEYLIQKGAIVDALKRADWTPLMLACTKDSQEAYDCVVTLLRASADPTLRNKDGWNSLHLACRSGNIQMIELLVTYSPNSIDIKTNNGRNSLHIAAFHGHGKAIDFLGPKCKDLNARDSTGCTPLLSSACSGDCVAMKHLLNLGAEYLVHDNRKQNALHIAAQAGNIPMVEYILERKLLDIDSKDVYDKTPLNLARINNQDCIIEIFRNYNADK
ncbi:ankyrin repeat domain-containing protein 16 [Cephus cinctus]|uniref:Ankyrin repeat domain-containing protein 16 n=1 Tax=Cephus cinctus TaxID=211228 RepID=A0AAJ7FKQ6_CEPCN|nr:ankyrin repeat domain-containing protein 16 [Cephus cinctus]